MIGDFLIEIQQIFSYARYQYNKVKLFSNIDDYENNEINKILKSSPSLNQQLIIPISEFKRLEKNLKNLNQIKIYYCLIISF